MAVVLLPAAAGPGPSDGAGSAIAVAFRAEAAAASDYGSANVPHVPGPKVTSPWG